MEAQSPFLPGTNIQFAWDSTSLGYYKTCPRLYYYQMILGYVPKDENIHLRFGIEYHKALEDYDRFKADGNDHEEAMRYTIHRLLFRIHGWRPDRMVKAGKYKNERSIVELVIDYLDKFGEADPAKTIILDNGRPAVELSFRFELDFGPSSAPRSQTRVGEEAWSQPYILCGHLDRAVEFAGAVFTMDRKTTTWTISSTYFDQWEPNNQMSLYSLAGKVVLGTTIKGVIIDAAQLLLEKPHKFERGFTYRTPDQLDEWVYDLQYLLADAERDAIADYWRMNDTSCDKFGGCKFRQVCSKSAHVRERILKSNFTQLPPEERWNPLKPR